MAVTGALNMIGLSAAAMDLHAAFADRRKSVRKRRVYNPRIRREIRKLTPRHGNVR